MSGAVMRAVVWEKFGMPPVYHLVHGRKWAPDDDRPQRGPMCGGKKEMVSHRPDGVYCRLCIGLELAL